MDEPVPTRASAEESAAGPSRARSRMAVFGSIAAISLGSVVGVALAIANRRTAPLPRLAVGWTRHAAPAQGFSIDFPPGWKAVSTTSSQEAADQLKDDNNALAGLVRGQTGVTGSNLIKLLAFDVHSPTIAQSFATNVTVVVIPVPNGAPFDTFVDDNVSQLRATPGVGSTIDVQRLQLVAGDAALIHAHLTASGPGGDQTSTISQYLLQRGSRGYIISFTTLPSELPAYTPLFDRTARSFRFV